VKAGAPPAGRGSVPKINVAPQYDLAARVQDVLLARCAVDNDRSEPPRLKSNSVDDEASRLDNYLGMMPCHAPALNAKAAVVGRADDERLVNWEPKRLPPEYQVGIDRRKARMRCANLRDGQPITEAAALVWRNPDGSSGEEEDEYGSWSKEWLVKQDGEWTPIRTEPAGKLGRVSNIVMSMLREEDMNPETLATWRACTGYGSDLQSVDDETEAVVWS